MGGTELLLGELFDGAFLVRQATPVIGWFQGAVAAATAPIAEEGADATHTAAAATAYGVHSGNVRALLNFVAWG